MGWGVWAQRAALVGARFCFLRTSEGSYFSSSPSLASCGCRTAEAYRASSTGRMELSLWLGASNSSPLVVSPNSFHMSICARPCTGHLGHYCFPRLTWPCPCGAHSQVGEPDNESCDWEAESRHCPRLELGMSSWKRQISSFLFLPSSGELCIIL